jgi:hypothetical protein
MEPHYKRLLVCMGKEISFFFVCEKVNMSAKTRNTNRRGRLSTVDLLIKVDKLFCKKGK